MVKLDDSGIRWIIRMKEQGVKNAEIASVQNVSVRRTQQIYAQYRKSKQIPSLKKAGRPRKDVTEFEDYLDKNGIRHILAMINHPQTNGKLERFYGEVERKSHLFKDIHELTDWYKNIRPNMSLNLDVLETPSQAYVRKLPKEGIVVDEQSGEIYNAKEE